MLAARYVVRYCGAMYIHQNHKLAPIVYAILLVIAVAAGVITLSNEAGWWHIDF
jgi:hypothetical protein